MLENVDQKVTEQLTTQGLPTPKPDDSGSGTPAPAVPPSNGVDDLRGQLARAVDEIAALKAERGRESVEREAAVTAERLKVASAIAKQAPDNIGGTCGQQDIKFDQAVSAVGGRAFFAKLTLAQQAAALCVTGIDTPVKVVSKYFGRESNGMEANNLLRTNRQEYLRLRMLAKLHGLI